MQLPRPSLPSVATLRSFQAQFTFDTFAACLMAIIVITTTLGTKPQTDTWWVIRSGHEIVTTGHIPTVEIFSWTMNGGYWPNHEWLTEVIFYCLYALGGMPGLVVGCALLLSAVWVGIYRSSVGPGRLRAALILLGIMTQITNLSLRPHLMTLIFLGVALLLLGHVRLHWLYPVLFLAWTNAHGGVAFGGVLLITACIVALFCDRGRLWHWGAVTAASGIATLINPLGIGLWWLILHSTNNEVLKLGPEWRPPSLNNIGTYAFLLLVCVWLGVLIWKRRTWRGHYEWTLILCSMIFVWLGFQAWRNISCFAFIAPLLLTRPFQSLPSIQFRTPALKRFHLAVLGAVAIGACVAVADVWSGGMMKPALSTEVVGAVRRCDGNLFNSYAAGGYLLWGVPERKVFIDDRQDPYPPEFILRTIAAEWTGDYHALFTEYQIDCAVVEPTIKLYTALRSDGWVELGSDTEYAVLRRPE